MTPHNCCFEPSNSCSLAGLHPEHQQRERHARTPDVVLGRLWNAISEALFGDTAKSRTHFENVRTWAQIAAPVVWLLGKTGAGKTAIVSALTGDTRAAIGEGFAPCTRSAAFYDVPAEAPLLRFLDTRGLGEVDYDPAADIAWCEGRAHLLLVAPPPSRVAGCCRPNSSASALSRGRRTPRIVSLHGRPGRRAQRIDPASPAPGIELPARAVCGTPRPAAAVCPRRFHPA